MRIQPLEIIKANYPEVLKFLDDRSVDNQVDSTISAKASGFYDYVESFECVFYLTMMIEIFDRIEILNIELQKSSLCVIESHEKVKAVADVLNASRDSKFEEIWEKSVKAVIDFELREPQIPRQRKIPERIDEGITENFKFLTPKDYFRRSYCEVFDQLIGSLERRFNTEAAKFFEFLERFAIGQTADVDKIVNFYKDDFDRARLLSDRDMFLQLLGRQNEQANNLGKVVNSLKKYEWARGLIPDFVRFVRLLITIPGSSCSNERSFSVLRRLKTYLRSTMSQNALQARQIWAQAVCSILRSTSNQSRWLIG